MMRKCKIVSSIVCLSLALAGMTGCDSKNVEEPAAMEMEADRAEAVEESTAEESPVEKKPEALELLRENARRLHAANLTAVAGLAPEACKDLPAPTHVFIGGSSGRMEALLRLIWEKNPRARIAATAVALETVGELARCAKIYGGDGVCIAAANTKAAGPYTLMQGQNPVYLFTFPGRGSHEA